MSEGEIIEQLVEYLTVLFTGISVYFAIVSAYIVGLYAFLGRASITLKIFAFSFLTLTMAILLLIMAGAQSLHDGLIAALAALANGEGLSPAGRAALANERMGIDPFVSSALWTGAGVFYIGLLYLTFVHPWERVRVAGEEDG